MTLRKARPKRTLVMFNNLSLDGFFTDAKGDMSWAHRAAPDPEFDAFIEANAKGGAQFLFGRKTYELMAGFWPTPAARTRMPGVAQAMNAAPKIVFSRTLRRAAWSGTRLVSTDPASEVRRLKRTRGPGLVILGSGSLVAQLAPLGLIDEYQIVLIPLALGAGRTLFEGMAEHLPLRLVDCRSFANGNVFARYRPLA